MLLIVYWELLTPVAKTKLEKWSEWVVAVVTAVYNLHEEHKLLLGN